MVLSQKYLSCMRRMAGEYIEAPCQLLELYHLILEPWCHAGVHCIFMLPSLG